MLLPLTYTSYFILFVTRRCYPNHFHESNVANVIAFCVRDWKSREVTESMDTAFGYAIDPVDSFVSQQAERPWTCRGRLERTLITSSLVKPRNLCVLASKSLLRRTVLYVTVSQWMLTDNMGRPRVCRSILEWKDRTRASGSTLPCSYRHVPRESILERTFVLLPRFYPSSLFAKKTK